MHKVDSHHHFWKYDPGEYAWINESMGAIKRDFLPENLLKEMAKTGIRAVVSVQARQSIEETRWLLELADDNPFIKGVVGWAPLVDPSVEGFIEEVASHSRLKAIRHVLQDEPDGQYMLRYDFNRGIDSLKEYGLGYDILIFHYHLPAAVTFVDRHPHQIFVLDHIAKPAIQRGERKPWADDIRSLAERENVYCKLSGMVTEAEYGAWSYDRLVPYMDAVIEAFGPQRVMFGSDWPVCLLSAGYEEWVGIVARYLQPLSDDEQDAVWHGTAEKAYGL